MIFPFILVILPQVLHSHEPESKLIEGGHFTKIEKYPHHAVLIIMHNVRKQPLVIEQCAGFVVSSRWIVSGVHCLDELRHSWSSMKVRLGIDHYSQKGQVHDIELYTKHHLYSNDKPWYDISLLKTVKAIRFDEKVKPVALPSPRKTLRSFRKVYISGFGVYAEDPSTSRSLTVVPLRLMAVDLTIRNMSWCYGSVDPTSVFYGDWVHSDYLFCAGGWSDGYLKTICSGDYGSAAVGKRRNKSWVALGIAKASWCVNAGFFTKLSPYVRWIRKTVRKYS